MKLKIVIGCVALAAAASAQAMDHRIMLARYIGYTEDEYNETRVRALLEQRVEPLLARKGNAASSDYDSRIKYLRQVHEKGTQSDADYITEVGKRVMELDALMQKKDPRPDEWYYHEQYRDSGDDNESSSNSGIGAFFGKPIKCVQRMCGAAKTVIVAAVMGTIVFIGALLNKSNTQKPQGNLNDLD